MLETKRDLKSEDLKNMLLYPKLPPLYLIKNQIFALSEITSPRLSWVHFWEESGEYNISLSSSPSIFSSATRFVGPVTLKDPKFNGAFLRGPAMYIITDDLVVNPFSFISGLQVLNKSGISFDDVEEVVLNIGTKEALGILNASLSTSAALTNGLNLMLNKQQEE